MNSLLLWIGGLMVAVLGLLFAAPLVIDWNSYRGVLEEEATRILGRDVRVGGRVNLRLLPSPYVRFEKVRISDAGAALGEPFFRAEAFTLWLSPTPLLRGAIEASELELDRPVLRLAVDAEGRGNWQALRVTPGTMPFMPSDVVLQQVRVRQGVVSLKTPGATEPLTLSGIEGEIAADSLDGPYRFRGAIDWYGSTREIRIGTAQREADGKLRYKASVRAPDNGNQYALDGVLSELSPKGRHTGTMTAKLPLANVIASAPITSGPITSAPITSAQGPRARFGRGGETVDLTAAIDGDIDGIRLDNMAFSFEQDGKPQLMSGVSAANWRNGLRMETRLASRWLDLDQIAGQATPNSPQSQKASPVELLRRLLGQVSALLPPDGSSLLTVDVDQVNLGGAPLSSVRLAIARAGGLTSIGELKATLPGNARGELRGTLGATKGETGQAGLDTFDGEFLLRGGSYQRFGSWAGAGSVLSPSVSSPTNGSPEARPDAPFSLASKLRLLPEQVSLSDATFELAGQQTKASLNWRWGRERQIDVVAEGRNVDISAFAPGLLNLTAPARASPAPGTPPASTQESASQDQGFQLLNRLTERIDAINREVGSLKLRLKAGTLSDGTTTLANVDADLEVGTRALTINALRIGGPQTVRVELLGALSGLGATPQGAVRGWMAAGNGQAMASLAGLLPLSGQTISQRLLRDATDLDTAITIQLGAQSAAPQSANKSEDGLTFTAIGTLDGTHHTLDLKLDGGFARWRGAPIALGLKLEGPKADVAIRRLASSAPTAPRRTSSHAARLQIDAAGSNAETLVTSARLDLGATSQGKSSSTGSNASYQGKASIAADGTLGLAGTVQLAATNAAELASFITGEKRPFIEAAALSGTLALERKGGTTSLATDNLTAGASRFTGQLTITERADRTRLDARLTANVLDIPSLLGLGLDGEPAPASIPASQAADSPWPDAPFALASLDAIEGQVTITAPLARLTPGLELEASETRLGLSPGRIEISSLTGAALGGRFSARGTIERAQAGASVSLETRLTGATFERLGAGDLAPTGSLNFFASASGRSLTPRAAIASLSGKGEIEIRGGRATGIAANLVERIAEATVDVGEEITREKLQGIITAERSRGAIALGNRKLALDIADGIARIAPLEITADEATLKNTTTVDLAAMKADSEWQITPRRPWSPKQSTRRREALPTLSLVWNGPIGTVARQPPRVSLDALERDLNIRRLERDAEKLEELRRQDEERARNEVERQRRLEDSGSTGPVPASPTNASGGPSPVIQGPVIQAPFNIQPRPPADQGPQTPPQPQSVSPPAPRPANRADPRTLKDVFNGQ